MKPLKKSALRAINKNRGRYFAILAIIALGVGFFCGLRICRPAMVRAGDEYIQESNLFDYRLISTLGFTAEDQDYFAALEGVNEAEGAVWTDFLCTGADGNDRALRAHSLTENINRLSLVAGHMPEADDEMVGDARLFTEADIGRKVLLSEANDADTLEKFRHRSYTLVGIANSAYYLNYERGNTSIGSGTLAGFVYLPYDGFDLDYFTEIFVDIDAPGEIYSEEYNAALANFEDLLEAETEARADLRYRSLVDDAQQEIDDAQAELDEKFADYQQEKSDANAELNDAHDELEDAEQKIADGEDELSANESKLSSAESQYRSGLRKYESSLAEFEAQRDAALQQISDAQAQIDANRAAAEEGIRQIEDSGALESHQQLQDAAAQLQSGIDALEAERSAQLSQPQAQLDTLKEQLAALDDGIAAAEAERDAAVSGLNAQIDSLRSQISGWEGEIADLDAEDPEQASQIDALRGKISDAEGQIPALEGEISTAESACASQVESFQSQKQALQPDIDALVLQIDGINAGFDAQRSPLDSQLAQVQTGMQQIEDSGVLAQYEQAKSALAQLDAAQTELDAQSAAAQAELDGYQAQLDAASAELKSSKRQIQSGKSQLESGRTELESAREELQQGYADYETALIDAERQFADAEEEFADAQAEIDDAQAEVNDIEPATLYALSRKTNIGYACFENDSMIVHGISSVFPLFFLLVAALVCTTTMTRMVDEQRTEIGTLKALGYSKGAIMSKYLFYSGSAAFIGALIGYFGGSHLFPRVIWTAYDIMYGFAEIPYVLSPLLGAVSLGAALLCSMGATWFSCNVELSEVPAQLIRPKSPKAGKRVLLERVGFLWKRLSFLRKVTVRNVFRYKKRLMMMVLGIGGCTALLVTGFGINDSIANLGNDQFGRIMLYDLSVSFAENQTEEDQDAFTDALGDDAASVRFVHQGSVDVAYGDQTKQVNLIVSDGSLDGYIDLHSGDEAIDFPDLNQCVISRSLMERCGLTVGDQVTVYDDAMQRMELTVSGVFDNYIYNYLIVHADSVAAQWGEAPEWNSALVNCAEGVDPHSLSATISGLDGVSNVTVNQDVRDRFDNMMSSLNYIVILVVVCAAALAFIVLYNLTNINITERIREIATVKVLGFTLRETASYALSENLLLSVIGAVVGLPLGKALHAFVMAQIKVDMVIFDVRVTPLSYCISVALTLLFAWLVNLFMLRKIDRINMAESLKTIE
ncbi:MAG: FtsX-like permease family protein [Clostridia bacterium]|nr:FtsX-like permease family protein [Clostridia bacterium]